MVVLQAMGRIFVGLCQVGAWGCFDEFNRLEERMLSACSQQIQTIQEALKEHASKDAKDKGWFVATLACFGVGWLQCPPSLPLRIIRLCPEYLQCNRSG